MTAPGAAADDGAAGHGGGGRMMRRRRSIGSRPGAVHVDYRECVLRGMSASIMAAVVMFVGASLAGLVAGGGGLWQIMGFGLLVLAWFVAMFVAAVPFDLDSLGLVIIYGVVGTLLLLGAAPCYLAVDGRRVDAVITGFRHGGAEGNRQSQIDVLDPATEQPLGRIGFLGLERPQVGDTVPVLASRHGWLAPVGAEAVLTRAAGWLVAASALAALWSVRIGAAIRGGTGREDPPGNLRR